MESDGATFIFGRAVVKAGQPAKVRLDAEVNMAHQPVADGFDVFVHDGDKAFGAVRSVSPSELVVYVEGAGDFAVPLSAVDHVDSGKVVVNCAKIEHRLRRAIGHAHEGEDPRI